MNNSPYHTSPEDDLSITECKTHGDYEGNYCPDCYLAERRREMAQEVSEGMVETMKAICVDFGRELINQQHAMNQQDQEDNS